MFNGVWGPPVAGPHVQRGLGSSSCGAPFSRRVPMDVSRRDFLVSGTMVAAGGVVGNTDAAPILLAQAPTLAARGFNPADPAMKYELVIANGEVLDPSQKLRGKRDIGIK